MNRVGEWPRVQQEHEPGPVVLPIRILVTWPPRVSLSGLVIHTVYHTLPYLTLAIDTSTPLT